MSYLSQCVVVIFLLIITGTHSKISLKNETKRENLVEPLRTIVKKVYFELGSSETNWLTLTDDTSEANDFMDGILFEGDFLLRIYDFPRVWNIADRKRRNNLIVLDDIKFFRNFNAKVTPDIFAFRGLFTFVLLNGKIDEIEEIFKSFWSKNIYNVNVMIEERAIVKVFTFFPYSGSICGDTKPVLINTYENGAFSSKLESFFPKKFQNLRGCPLVISTFEEPLAVIRKRRPDGKSELSGFDVELLEEISKLLNFHLEFKVLEVDRPWGFVLPNGTSAGALGDVYKGNSQLAVGRYNLYAERMMVLDSSVAYHSFPGVFVISPGRKMTNIEKFQKPFENLVWFSLLAVLLFAFLVFFVLSFGTKSMKSFVYGTGVKNPVMNVFAAIFGLSQPKLPKRNFARFIFAKFLIFCLVFRSAYQGSLFNFLQTDKNLVSVKTLDDLVTQKFNLFAYKLNYFDNLKETYSRFE